MTPEKIAEVRHQAAVTFLQKIWEGTAQIGLQAAADAAQAQAELAEIKAAEKLVVPGQASGPAE